MTIKLESLLDGAVVDTININEDEDVTAIFNVTGRVVYSRRKKPGGDRVSTERVGRDSTAINFTAVASTLAAADKLRKMINDVDIYDEVRLFLNSSSRYYVLTSDSSATDFPGGMGPGFHPIQINARGGVFEQGSESTSTFQEDMTYTTNGDKSGDTVLWMPNLAGVNRRSADSSSNGNNGDIRGAIAIDTPFGPGLEFDGLDARLDVINPLGTVKTIMFWFKADDVTSQKLINIDGTDQIEVDGSDDITATSFPGATVIYVDGAVATAVSNDTWHHIVVTDATGVSASVFQIAKVGATFGKIKMASVTVLSTVLTATDVLDKYNEEKTLINLDNAGNVYTRPNVIKITGVDEPNYLDQILESTGDIYTVGVAIDEGATHRQTFYLTKARFTKIAINVVADGGSPIDITIHDAANNSLCTATVSGSTGILVDDCPIMLSPDTAYHFHLTTPAGVTTVLSTTNEDLEDGWFQTLYVEPTRNPTLYDDADEDNKFTFGKESIDQENEFHDSNSFTTTSVHRMMTFTPDKTKMSKVSIFIKKTGVPPNIRGQIRKITDSDGTPDGDNDSIEAYFHISHSEVSTTEDWVVARLVDVNGKELELSMDITSFYGIYLKRGSLDGQDGGNFYDWFYITTDEYANGQSWFDADDTGTYSTNTRDFLFRTYYPDTISCPIPDGGDIEIDSKNGIGDLTFLLAQSDGTKDLSTVHEVSGAEYDQTNLHWDLVTDGDHVVWRIASQYPMKNIKISTVKVHADQPIALLWSLDDSTYTIFRVFDNATETTFTDIELPSSLDNKNLLYIKAEALGTDADNSLSDMTFQADVNNKGAVRPKIPAGSNNIWLHGMNELSSGRATINLTFNDQYHT